MEQKTINRHSIIYISDDAKKKIYETLSNNLEGDSLRLAKEIFKENQKIPGFVRRDEPKLDHIAIGFVHYCRIDDNRLRLGTYVHKKDILTVMSPYDLLHRKAYSLNLSLECMKVLASLTQMADLYDLKVGVFGSAALELATDLPYVDEASDIDLLIKAAPYEKLLDFYRCAKENFKGINLDFEVELPNGYGVKLAEIFMETKTILGKSLSDVRLLERSEVMQCLR